MARIQEAVDEWSVKAATEVLMALTAPENEDTATDGSVITAATSVPVDEVIELVTRFVAVVSRAHTLEAAEPSGLSEWRYLAHKWFMLLIDSLQKGRGGEVEKPVFSEM